MWFLHYLLSNEPSSDESAKLTNLVYTTAVTADTCGWPRYNSLHPEHFLPRHDAELYHTYDHFREVVIDTIVLIGIYNKAVKTGQLKGELVSTKKLAVMVSAMALHDWHRGPGKSEKAYGMEIRAAEAFVQAAKTCHVPENYMRDGVIAILATSPFVGMYPAKNKNWFVGEAAVGNYAFLADQVEGDNVLNAVPGLVDQLRNMHEGTDSKGIFWGQLATCADVLTGTVLGRAPSERNNKTYEIEIARATDKEKPIFDDAGLMVAQSGKNFLNYIGQLPVWMDQLTGDAFGQLKASYEVDVVRLSPPPVPALALS